MPFFPSEKTVSVKSIESRYFDPAQFEISKMFPFDAEITVLRDGSPGQRTRLLSAACKEAANRELPIILWHRHDRVQPVAAALGNRIFLFTEPVANLPVFCEEISLSPLIDRSTLLSKKTELSDLTGKIARLQEHYGMLRSADLSLASLARAAAEPCLLIEKLSAFCRRFFDKLRLPADPSRSMVRFCVSTPGQDVPAELWGRASARIGVSDRVGGGGLLLNALSAEAERRGIAQQIYTDAANVPVGIYLPAGDLCIGGSAGDKGDRSINCGRFVSKQGARQIRPMVRSIYAQRQEIGRLIADRRRKIADLTGKIDEIYDFAVKAGEFADFEKDLLISLFCR